MNNILKYLLLALASTTISVPISAAIIPQQGDNPIVFDQNATFDNITYLMAAGGERPDTTSVQTYGNPKHAWLKSIDSSEYVQWDVEAGVGADYHVTMLVNASANNSFKLEVVGGTAIDFTVPVSGWQRSHFGVIAIPSGVQTLRLTRTSNNGDIHLKSLELIENSKRAAQQARIASFKSDATTFSNYDYGLMFQYGGWGYPQSGAAKSLDAQAADFNVINFVNMVKSTGAKYIIWSSTWWTYEFNTPLPELDNLLGHSNRTSNRDLIGDIATALDAEGIGFFLYYHTGQDSHLGYNSTDWWQLNNWPSSFINSGTGDRTTFFDNWKTVISAIGNQYGTKLDGWFFDDGLVYYPAPFESLGAAAKAGNPDRLISYNPWIVAHYTDFEDLSFGEECKDEGAPHGGIGLYTSTGDKGVYGHCMPRMENDWGIRSANQSIGSPNYSAQSAFNIVTDRASKNVPTSFNLMMYEDGTVAQASLDVLTGLKAVLVNTNGQTTINNDDTSVTYAGGTWNESNNRGVGDYLDDVAYTTNNDDYFEYTFTGSGIEIISEKYSDQGDVEIILDSLPAVTVDTTYSTRLTQQVIFSKLDLASGSHTIKVTKKTGQYMLLDSLKITN